MPLWLRCAMLSVCLACAPTHHVLRSRWVDTAPPPAEPAVQLAQTAQRPKRLSVVGCETGCEAAVRSLEDALFAARFELIDGRLLAEDAARHQRTTLETAAALGLDHVLFVARVPSAPRVIGHFERSYFASPGQGQVGPRITPSAQQADRFDVLLARAEANARPVERSAGALSVTLVRVTGEQTLRFRSELAAARGRTPDLTVFVHCQNGSCGEERAMHEPVRAPRNESRHVQTSGTAQASFAELARSLVDRLVALPAS